MATLKEQAKIATLAGHVKFISTVPCKKCGGLERYTTACTRCVTCAVNRDRDKNQESEYKKRHYQENREMYKEKNAKAYQKRVAK